MRPLVIISQVYPPDPAAVGQHIADVAQAMATQGWVVTVYTANRGYDDPQARYASRESLNGVNVRRFGLSSFGKQSIAIRLIAQASFLAQAVITVLLTCRPSILLVSTSPPFAGFGAAVVAAIRRVPFVWWVMDINPDQMVATGKISASALATKVFEWMNRITLARAAKVVTLDPFMAATLRRKAASADIDVVPPWAPAGALDSSITAVANFKRQHGLEGQFIVMYSGNHALCHPLTTLLDAAAEIEGDTRFRFVFVGGGSGKAEVDDRIARGARNLLSLPYQPRESLAVTLSTADLHVVSMGDAMVGVVHPCKIYGVLAIGKPILLLGPGESAAGAIVASNHLGWTVSHGDVRGMRAALVEALSQSPADRAAVCSRAAALSRGPFRRDSLVSAVCGILTSIVPSSCR
jgi:colanic acid biosynthesis glycosyl transferase WcaI